MLILGIESSCDETAAALVEDGSTMLSNVVATQIDLHARYGGIVPEVAARKHVETVGYVIKEAIESANKTPSDIEAIAVTAKRGLVGSLLVGVAAAKSLAYTLNVPLIGVHHIEGHIFANMLSNPKMPLPHMCLTVSGGHTMLVHVKDYCKYEILGNTLDDAAGEAYDKIAKFLGLGFPGGPVIDKLAAQGNAKAYNFPRPLLRQKNLDFSFSGLKTSVTNMFKDKDTDKLPVQDISAGFQQAVIDVLVSKTMRAALQKEVPAISVTGGVAANKQLRDTFTTVCEREGIEVFFPQMSLCGDNGAMIAAAGYHRMQYGDIAGLDLNAIPNAPLKGIE